MRRPAWAVGVLISGALCGLAACERAEPEDRVVERGASSSAAVAAAAPPPSSAAAEFVGVWAARPEDCARNQTWRFTPDRLAAPGGVNCAIEGAARAPQGWRLQASCNSQGVSRPSELDLATAAEAESDMTLAGGPFGGPVALVRCTPPLSAR